MHSFTQLVAELKSGDFKALARVLTLVENDIEPAMDILKGLEASSVPVIGFTGPPGAGKSTLVSAVAGRLSAEGKRVGILAVDPTSPFNFGSLLGDRIRMSGHFNDPNVFIRSLATRGALGGISAKTIEMTDVFKAAGFDAVLVETVGVGQSEIEVAGIADTVILVLVPESGDEIQHIKSGIMEIAQALVVNKADRDYGDAYTARLKKFVSSVQHHVPVFKTVADKGEGVDELMDWLNTAPAFDQDRRVFLLAEKAFKIIQHHRMRNVDRDRLYAEISAGLRYPGFNLYRFVDQYNSGQMS
ncbi:methylmalonyl Co-A mutase-associated GTPase MeaB [Pedobacter deserti]|uniref:methylmalonyl Co-A mutase-associated GTPase MeaB n=1 Tax=Pedobacter deserti TaxID=2817382 RepID=UPI00210E6EC2|nr:methylmalonyl Co-A mutase-associated GTPase MeaB [Pedobacter sp. SYSU D00382]